MVTLLDAVLLLACLLAGLTDKPNRASSQTGKGWGERFSRIRRARAAIRLSIPRMHVHVRSSRSDGHDPRPELPSSPASKQVDSNRSWMEECPSSRCAAIRQMVQCTTVRPRKQLFVYSSSTISPFIASRDIYYACVHVEPGCIDRPSCSGGVSC